MAQLLIAPAGEAGITTGFFRLRRLADGYLWSTSGGGAWEAYNASHIANYGIAATETGSAGEYTATNPDPATPAHMEFVKAAGASLAVSDLVSNVYYEGPAGPALGDWGAVVLGNDGSRDVTRDMLLMGYVPKVVQADDGLSFTIYMPDGATELQTVDDTRFAPSVGGLKNLTPRVS